jgi:ribosomal-protein-alanine N-acetyltransferase
MSEQPALETERLRLRPFTPDDAPAAAVLANDPEIAANTLSFPYPYELSMAEEWIASQPERWERGELANFAMVLREGDVLAGSIGLIMVPAHGRAELGYWVGRPFWGLGVCTEAARAVVDFGFRELGLNRIQAHHFTRNPASGKVMRKIGMRYEGSLRQWLRKGDVYEDAELYAILRRDHAARY